MKGVSISNMAEATKKKKVVNNETELETSLNALLNEADDEDKVPEVDGDLDDLMKDSSGSKDDDKGSDDLDKIPDLTTNDNDDAPKDDDTLSNDKEVDNKEDLANKDKDNFEASADDLTATIQKLAQSGHTVKILITKEGAEPNFTLDGKDDKVYSIKEVNALLEAETKGGSESMKDTINNKVLDEKYDKILENMDALIKIMAKRETSNTTPTTEATSSTNNINDVEGVVESTTPSIKTPKIVKDNGKYVVIGKEDYANFINESQEMHFQLEKANIDKLTYSFDALDEDEMQTTEELTKAFNEADSQFAKLNESNKAFVSSTANKRFASGGVNALSILSEDIMPHLNDLLSVKNLYLNDIENHDILADASKSIREANDLKIKYKTLLNENYGGVSFNYDRFMEESINSLNIMNKTDMITMSLETLIESSDSDMISKGALIGLLQEAAAQDISVMDNDKGYDTNYPTYEIFSKSVMDRMKKINMSSDKSDIADVRDDDKLVKGNEVTKYELPVLAPEKYNANITIKSAIANLVEGLVDDDGNTDLNLCEQAYLYKKVRNPQSIKDFAMPIAIVEGVGADKKLMAHPKLIENVAHILKNESCMKVYDIATRDDLYSLRENLLPYLERIGMDAPWLPKTDKKNVATPNAMNVISE